MHNGTRKDEKNIQSIRSLKMPLTNFATERLTLNIQFNSFSSRTALFIYIKIWIGSREDRKKKPKMSTNGFIWMHRKTFIKIVFFSIILCITTKLLHFWSSTCSMLIKPFNIFSLVAAFFLYVSLNSTFSPLCMRCDFYDSQKL